MDSANGSMLEFLEKELKEKTGDVKSETIEPSRIPTSTPAPSDDLDFTPVIAVTGDWHLFRRQYNIAKRIDDIYNACDQIVDAVNQLGIPLVVHTGDLFHRNVMRPLALQQAIQLFTKINSPVLAIRGNHDGSSVAARNKDTMLNNLNEIDLIEYVEEGIIDKEVGDIHIRFYCVSYCGKNIANRLDQLVATDTEHPENTIRVLVIHGIVEGMDMVDYAIDIQRDDLAKHGFDLVLSGHHHTKWHDGVLNAFNAGSPETMDMKCAGMGRGFWVIGFQDGVVRSHFHPINPRPFIDLTIDVGTVTLEECNQKVVDYIKDHDTLGSIVRLTVTGTVTDGRVWEFRRKFVKKSFKKALYVTDVVNNLRDFVDRSDTVDDESPVLDERKAFKVLFQNQFQEPFIDQLVDVCISSRDELVGKRTGRHDVVKTLITDFVQKNKKI